MKKDVSTKILEIKKSFRLRMNGIAAQSMREKGLDYKINWGIGLPQLKEMAEQYGKNYDLAIALWKEDVRECKILATLIMPADKMLPEVVDIWMEQTYTQELAELSAFNLYQYLTYAPVMAFKWIASSSDIPQLCGYHLLARLFIKGQEPNERGVNEFLDQVSVVLESGNINVRHAALTCVEHFCNLGDVYIILAKKALSQHHLPIFE